MENDLRYPIGRFTYTGPQTSAERARLIQDVAETPGQMKNAVSGIAESHLDTPYREGGWSVRQIVHHVADSHLNSYVRLKLALTEDVPTIKPYDQDLWASLPDSRQTPVEISLLLLDALHRRWVTLLRSMSEEQFARTFRHPEMGLQPLDRVLGLYAWHGRHHTAQIVSLRQRSGW